MIDVDDAQEDEGGITIDDTSEFVRAITYDPTPVKREPTEASLKRAISQEPSRQASAGPSKAEVVDDPMEEIEAGEVVVKEEEDEEAILNAIENAIRETEAAEKGGPRVRRARGHRL